MGILHAATSRDGIYGMLRSGNKCGGRSNLGPGDEPEDVSTHPLPHQDFQESWEVYVSPVARA